MVRRSATPAGITGWDRSKPVVSDAQGSDKEPRVGFGGWFRPEGRYLRRVCHAGVTTETHDGWRLVPGKGPVEEDTRVTVKEKEIVYTRAEIARELERGAHQRLGGTAVRMIEDYRAGRLERYSDVADLLMLADLLPASDPLSPRRDR